MTSGTVAYLKKHLDPRPLSITANSEAEGVFDRDSAYRDQTQRTRNVVRGILEEFERQAVPDDTLVPALPTPEDRWAWLSNAVKGGIVGAALALHLVEVTVIAWLVLDAARR